MVKYVIMPVPTVGTAYELALNCTFQIYFPPLPKTVHSYDFGWA
jgi:hypothetical protein